jgi:outer membrane lipoprotein-sorting protein
MLAALLMYNLPSMDAAEVAVQQAQHAYEAIKSAKLKVAFDTKDAKGHELKGAAEVLFQGPGKLRAVITLDKGKVTTIVCDGNQFTVLLPKGGRMRKFAPDDLASVLPLNLETFCLFNAKHERSIDRGGGMEGSRLSLVQNEMWNGKKWDVLEERNAPEDVLDRYFIDPSTHLIWRVLDESLTSGKVYTETHITSLALGEAISPDKFSLSKG